MYTAVKNGVKNIQAAAYNGVRMVTKIERTLVLIGLGLKILGLKCPATSNSPKWSEQSRNKLLDQL